MCEYLDLCGEGSLGFQRRDTCDSELALIPRCARYLAEDVDSIPFRAECRRPSEGRYRMHRLPELGLILDKSCAGVRCWSSTVMVLEAVAIRSCGRRYEVEKGKWGRPYDYIPYCTGDEVEIPKAQHMAKSWFGQQCDARLRHNLLVCGCPSAPRCPIIKLLGTLAVQTVRKARDPDGAKDLCP
nr:hypothetical protein CFP56_13032 [Quercus suber]